MTVHRMEDYRVRFGVGQTVGTGFYEKTRNGKQREIKRFEETYETHAGNFKIEQWNQIMRTCITAAGAKELFTKIVEYCRTNRAWLKTDKDREEYALEIIAGRSYRFWKDFSTEGLPENTAFVFWIGG